MIMQKKFGPYIKIDKTYVSLKEPYDPFTMKEKEAIDLYKEKLVQIEKRNIADFGTIKILLGPYGPYITDGKKNARIPKDIDPKTISEKEATKMLADAPEKKRKFSRKKIK